ncbi:Disease resistance protein (CC-NBS-LRR class) family protein [Rhynchospora pubera]|uniref:Disease resistance protein (CC-NBS-LRR class) family protein n=1 Tax=Rhynchospora pubera TaxID=906938 RepID=A0AAV8CYN8_9POAL|nr:Disease resistance protein (CC-NBS-LRR class) family protein [Rhynchospora pubera]
MIQVSSRHSIGSIKSCRLHDLLRDLAMHHAEKENFVTVFPKPQGVNHPHRVIRRASLQSVDYAEFINYVVDKNTRSLLCLGRRRFPVTDFSSEIVKFRLLRVVEIENARIKIAGIDGLIHMKYLGLRGCYILEWPSKFLWFRLKNLETLDFRDVQCSDFRGIRLTDLWKIGTLRHVLFSFTDTNPWKGLPSNADLTNLQNLGWVTGEHAWRNQLPCLKNLRKLKFNNGALREPRIVWDVVGHLLETLPYLQTLEIAAGYDNDIPKEIVYPRGLPNYQNLQILYLKGALGVNKVEASLFPEYLVKLTLIHSKLKEDPMPELGRLKTLQKLQIGGYVYSFYVHKFVMICPVGFPVLQTLWLDIRGVLSLTIMEGVMPKLKHLTKKDEKMTINLPRELSQFSP